MRPAGQVTSQYSRFYAGELRALISVAARHGKVVLPKLIPEARETLTRLESMLGSLSWFILNVHEEANYCHETRPIARILSPFPPRANRGNPPRLFWSRTRVTVRPISLLVSKECLAEVYASRRFRFRCGLHPSFLLFFFFLISAVSRWITRHLWAKIGLKN